MFVGHCGSDMCVHSFPFQNPEHENDRRQARVHRSICERVFHFIVCMFVGFGFVCLLLFFLIIIIHVAILAEWLILMELAHLNTQKSRLRGLRSGWSDHCGLQIRLSLIQVVSN